MIGLSDEVTSAVVQSLIWFLYLHQQVNELSLVMHSLMFDKIGRGFQREEFDSFMRHFLHKYFNLVHAEPCVLLPHSG